MVQVGKLAASLVSLPLNVGRNFISGTAGAASNVLRRGTNLLNKTGKRVNGTLKETTAVIRGGKRRTNRNRKNKNRSNKNRSNKNRNRH
jgi:hypothetical protein